MRYILFFFVITSVRVMAQSSNDYEISFENAVHHEANVTATFRNLEDEVLEVRMSRSSPGRYALHEFAKNVYNVKAVDSKGKLLTITRPNPYQWDVSGHDGTVTFTYTIFGDRGDGTYMQVDETHAHLNIPATFVFARGLDHRPVRVNFKLREDLKWKVATQLKLLGNTPKDGSQYFAPNLQYFMDSPTEISNFTLYEFDEESNGKHYTIRVALHHNGSKESGDQYFEGVKKIVKQEKAVIGELPDYDYGTYTFLACYMPQSSGDGMEHRNSTYVVGSSPLKGDGIPDALGTVSHEFFHCWNVERIRPASLEPFNFEGANMSGELWFAEGFTNYYTSLILCRAGLMTGPEYAQSLSGALNFVKNSPGRNFFNAIEMSYQAPFSDAARSIDPTNMSNTFISYYTYGQVIGLALDLTLRNEKGNLSLDGFMKTMWVKHGKPEMPYTVRDIKVALSEYAGAVLADEFFGKYVFGKSFPDYEKLLAPMGIAFVKAAPGKSYLGVHLEKADSVVKISGYARMGSPAYKSGLENNDVLVSINGKKVTDNESVQAVVSLLTPGSKVKVVYKRGNDERTAEVVLEEDPAMVTKLIEENGAKLDGDKSKRRGLWLDPR
ncbi:MAG: PDZ domain-containing protein [Chryseolinea sp.]